VDYNTTTRRRLANQATHAERNNAPISAKSTRNGSPIFNVAVATIMLTDDDLLASRDRRANAPSSATRSRAVYEKIDSEEDAAAH
jgi:hypothetical protein